MDSKGRFRRGPTSGLLAAIIFALFGCALLWWRWAETDRERRRLEISPYTRTLGNLKLLSINLLVYAHDHDERFPPKLGRVSDLRSIMPATMKDERFRSLNPNGGELMVNPWLAGRRLTDDPGFHGVRLLWDSQPWPGDPPYYVTTVLSRFESWWEPHAKSVPATEFGKDVPLKPATEPTAKDAD